MMDAQPTPSRLRFGKFLLDRRSGELRKSGSLLRLQEKPLRLLEALLERPGSLVTRDELRRQIWSDVWVDFDNSLNNAVNRLRTALGDDAERPRYVETVGGRGYRFIAAVKTPAATDDSVPVASAPGLVTASSPMRLAVLPFRLLQSDSETDFLAFSLPDAIAASLSGLESLAVRSSVAAARFASDSPDLPAIARALDVNLVLAGSIRRGSDRVRVSTQLLEAPRGTLLWTCTTDAVLDDLFRVPDELVLRIMESLSLPLTVRESSWLRKDVPASGKAYALYLRANGLARFPATWIEARDLYLESIRADPNYAPAWARLGRMYRLMSKYGGEDAPQVFALGEEALRRALALNPELSIAHHLYAQLELESARVQEALVRLVGRARERPSDPQLFVALVQACRYAGLLDASRVAHEHAIRLDATAKTSVGFTSWMAGDITRAIVEARLNADSAEGFFLGLAGRKKEAFAALDGLTQQYAQNELWAIFIDMVRAFVGRSDGLSSLCDIILRSPFRDPEGLIYVTIVLLVTDDRVRALQALRRAVDAGFACAPGLACAQALRALAGDPAFEVLRDEVDRRYQKARVAFREAGGDDLLKTSIGGGATDDGVTS